MLTKRPNASVSKIVKRMKFKSVSPLKCSGKYLTTDSSEKKKKP